MIGRRRRLEGCLAFSCFGLLAACGSPPPQELQREPAPSSSVEAVVCRCPQQPLATYYERADEVLVARLVGALGPGQSSPDGIPGTRAATDSGNAVAVNDFILEMVVEETPWKLSGAHANSLRAGDPVHYLTASSPAACGLSPIVGGVYLIFASAVPDQPGDLRVDTCSGTRLMRPFEGDEPTGFVDVPAAFVHSQLDALSGIDVLREAADREPDESDLANTATLGLLDLAPLAHGGTVTLRASPEANAPSVAVLRSYESIESAEVDYEVSAAIVVGRQGGWYRVRLTDGRSGWVDPDEAGTWFPYADLPVQRLAYLTGGWSGHVWPAPGAGIPARSPRKSPADREEYLADVLESTVVGGSVWFRISILRDEPCQGGTGEAELTGWVPAYGATGEPTVWYYSRGC